MSRTRFVVGNWKMNGSLHANAALLDAARAGVGSEAAQEAGPACRVAVCVPAPYLAQAADRLRGSTIAWGGQDASPHANGAYTGEVSAAMLADLGATLCLVGHSERRAYHAESDALVAAKTRAVHAAGLVPVVCVGETLEQRDAGLTFDIVDAQLRAVLDAAPEAAATMIVAYEPVWAIGTGRSATPEQAQEVHAHLRARLAERQRADTPILYGGSVKASNAASLFAMRDIDGGLIGGASLVVQEFLGIVAACAARTPD